MSGVLVVVLVVSMAPSSDGAIGTASEAGGSDPPFRHRPAWEHGRMTAGGPALRVFGGVAAMGEAGEVDLGGPKQRAVLALLLVDPRVVVSIDRIIDTIWGDDAPARAEVSVRGYVSNLRKALAAADDGAAIEFRDRGYVLLVEPDAIDLHRFEQA